MADVDETLDFARRGKLHYPLIHIPPTDAVVVKSRLTVREGKLHLEPTVVGLSKFNEAVQKLKNGQVAGLKGDEIPGR
ncbi:hypothetical protein LTR96_008185 [Exophiala xenobiotica]|uniref:Uncharacterized protein n=1 Tax=Vermiconidia calcicola TaxID=1690605 RepID=A0AAV9PXZ8_9PEZI|nr:hypothetical protein LTR96_008185 [Exophiala xenobiotica]KAK5529121.1 hypothetical protein LTR25_009858 [Vermiconidia calcicola]KAK5529350.1 hypothetical protein LTR23_010737 [Chaetothyriales sp. CCFEE 6169]KAK5335401.1 hypothetical protein LTR98_008401 [Exophiala xenobiotica]KAK5431587.1 hypothetical protein LTR34_004706 [Exophiala xenobiotica]